MNNVINISSRLAEKSILPAEVADEKETELQDSIDAAARRRKIEIAERKRKNEKTKRSYNIRGAK